MKTKDGNYSSRLASRHSLSNFMLFVFRISTLVGIIALSVLLYNIADGAFGYVVVQNKIDPKSLTEGNTSLEGLEKGTLVSILEDNISAGLFRRFENDMPFTERPREDVLDLIYERVVEPSVVEQWGLWESIFESNRIKTEVNENYPDSALEFKSWVGIEFIGKPQSADATRAGVRTAIYGSLWTIGIAIAFAFPIGVGAAIYLEEYANKKSFINKIIQTNIYNLAGVPSIIYGLLGLAIFARTLVQLTSGLAFGYGDPTTANGRTVLTAGLTLGLLVLPLMIINAQEAIKAVPNSLRQASYGLGATRWQTIKAHVLPNALPGILTGTILAISRAIGETAPLVVVGASHYITVDPTNPFSKFTTLPIQIYQWTARPQDVFRNLAAAAIVVLLVMLLSLNGAAIILRNRSRRSKSL